MKNPNVIKGYWTGQQKLVNCMTVSCVQALAARWRCRRLFTRTTLQYLAPPIFYFYMHFVFSNSYILHSVFVCLPAQPSGTWRHLYSNSICISCIFSNTYILHHALFTRRTLWYLYSVYSTLDLCTNVNK